MWNCDSRNMTGGNLSILFLFTAIVISEVSVCSSALSDKRLCYDPNCSVPVSLARTLVTYVPNEPGLLPFKVNVIAKVYSKEAGNRTDLWGVEINGKRGYVPKLFLKEQTILHKKLPYEVSTDPSKPNSEDIKDIPEKKIDASEKQNDNLDVRATEELPKTNVDATPPYEVIDGTTVHLDPKEPPVRPDFVKEVIQATAVPNEQNKISDLGVNTTGSVKGDEIEASKEVKTETLKVDVTDFVATSEVMLDIPKVSDVPSNISGILDNIKKFDEKTGEDRKNEIVDEVPQTLTADFEETLEGKTRSDEKGVSLAGEEIKLKVKTVKTSDEVEKDEKGIESETVVLSSDMKSGEEASESVTSQIKEDTQIEVDVTSIASKDEKSTTDSDAKSGEEASESLTSQINEDSQIKIDVTSVISEDAESTADSDMKSGEGASEPITSQIEEDTQIEVDVTSILSNEMKDTADLSSDVKSDEKISDSSHEIKKEDVTVTNDANEDIIVINDAKEDTIDSDKIEEEQFTIFKTPRDKLTIPIINIKKITIPEEVETGTEIDARDASKENVTIIVESLESVTKSGEIESSREEDLKKYGDAISPLFLESNINEKNESVVSSENIKDIPDATDPQPDLEVSSEAVSNVEEVKEIIYESSIESTLSVKEEDSSDVCTAEDVKCSIEEIQTDVTHQERPEENAIMAGIQIESSYWMKLMYLTVTAVATLMFSLGYYCIENMRRDRQLIARVNKLEKDLLISEAECSMANENLKSTKEKLNRMEDESFGSDEMVLSLRAEIEALQNVKVELEDQVAMLEKDLESATEAGLELERMLREVLSTNDDVNPLAQSVEDLQARLNAQQAANESLTNALNLKTQENDSLSAELASVKNKYEGLQTEFSRLTENLKLETNYKDSIERTLTERVQRLEMQIKEISTEKAVLQKELKTKEAEATDLAEVINRLNSNNLDLNKLYDVSHIKAEATALLEERNELKVRLAEIEGAHNLLEEHVKMVKEEMATLSEQYKLAEKEKKDAETRLEVLTNFFEEKEAQRQKEEAIWLQQQGEVVSTVERIQMMQTEIQNYKQQIEMLKREIMDQEREYKSQISLLETKAHEQWVVARQVERRLEESKVEAGQLRNRLTLIEKNMNDVDPETKLHRLEANGETTTSPPLFIGADTSSSSMMFSGASNVPPPPPSYLHSLFPPYLPPPLPNSSGVPPYDVSQRPPPLGGRLSSPPPMPLHPPNRYDGSPPPPMSPHLLRPFNHRSPPPAFGDIPPPPGSVLPPPPLGAPWNEDPLPPPRNPGFQPQRARNHKGSLHSSRESLDKLHHSKV